MLHVDNDSHLPSCSTSPPPPAARSSSPAPSTGPRTRPQLNASGVRPSSCTATSARAPARATWTTSTTGRAQTLVATDIAARGIHVDDVALVIHADPPVEHKAYLHRSGRTARAGNEGTVVTMMLDEQVRDVRDLTRKAGIKPTTTRVQLGHPLLTQLAPGERSYAGGLVREEAPSGGGGGWARWAGRRSLRPLRVPPRRPVVAPARGAAVRRLRPPSRRGGSGRGCRLRHHFGPASWRLRRRRVAAAAPPPSTRRAQAAARRVLGRQPRRLAPPDPLTRRLTRPAGPRGRSPLLPTGWAQRSSRLRPRNSATTMPVRLRVTVTSVTPLRP